MRTRVGASPRPPGHAAHAQARLGPLELGHGPQDHLGPYRAQKRLSNRLDRHCSWARVAYVREPARARAGVKPSLVEACSFILSAVDRNGSDHHPKARLSDISVLSSDKGSSGRTL